MRRGGRERISKHAVIKVRGVIGLVPRWMLASRLDRPIMSASVSGAGLPRNCMQRAGVMLICMRSQATMFMSSCEWRLRDGVAHEPAPGPAAARAGLRAAAARVLHGQRRREVGSIAKNARGLRGACVLQRQSRGACTCVMTHGVSL